MQEENEMTSPYAHIGDLDEKIFEGRRGFPLDNIGNVVPGQEILSVGGDSIVAFILDEDENDIYAFMPAILDVKYVNGDKSITLQPYGYSPILRINRRSVQDVCPIFYEKEQCYYRFTVETILSFVPEYMHPKLDKWLVYLTERVHLAKNAEGRSVFTDESEAAEAGSAALSQLSPELQEAISERMKEEYGADVEIKFVDGLSEEGLSDEEFDAITAPLPGKPTKIVH